MIDHIGIRVLDRAASARFYSAALAPLGYTLSSEDNDGAGLAKPGSPDIWLYRATAPSRVNVAFKASRAEVDGFYAAALGAGGRDNGAPSIREHYGPTYYAAFVLDPDGNNLEAVCLE